MSWCAFSVDMDSVEDYARSYPICDDPGLADEVYAQGAETMQTFLAGHGLLATLFVVTKDTFLMEETSTNILVCDVFVSLSHMKLRTARTAMTDFEF